MKTFFVSVLSFIGVFSPVILSAEQVQPIRVFAVITQSEVMGRLKEPTGLFFDESKKRLYVADSGGKRLVSLDAEYEYEYMAELRHDNFTLPTSIVRNADGTFFIVDTGRGELMHVNVAERKVEPFALNGLPADIFTFMPGRLAVDNKGIVYATDRVSGSIIVFDRSGGVIRIIKPSDKGFEGFSDVRVDRNGDLYALDSVGGSVYIFDNKGSLLKKFETKGGLHYPSSVAVNSAGLIYIADKRGGDIKVFDRNGALQYVLMTKGLNTGQLYAPLYVYIDKGDNIYVIDGNRLQIFKEEKQ